MEDNVRQNRYVCFGSFHSICSNNTRLLLCYCGQSAQPQRPLQTTKLLVRKYSWWELRQWWAELPAYAGISDPKTGGMGGQTEDRGIWVIITNDSLASKKPRRRSTPPATVWIPSSEEDEGDKWGSFRECCSTSHKLKSSFTSVSPSHGAKLGLTWPKYHLEHLSPPLGPRMQVQ